MYLLAADEDAAIKVGVMNKDSPRMDQLRRRGGFALIRRWACDDGQLALEIEQEVLRIWRDDLDAPPARPRGEDGWSETASQAIISVAQAERLIARVYRETKKSYEARRKAL